MSVQDGWTDADGWAEVFEIERTTARGLMRQRDQKNGKGRQGACMQPALKLDPPPSSRLVSSSFVCW